MGQRNADIAAFKKQLEDSGTKGLVIDLDETLSWTFPYMGMELVKLFENPQNLSVEELREKILAHDVPYWKLEEVRNRGL